MHGIFQTKDLSYQLRYNCFYPVSNLHLKAPCMVNIHLLTVEIVCGMPDIIISKSLFLNHYAPVNQAKWCNMTFTAGNLFPSHSCIGVTQVKPPLGFELGFPA